MIGMPLFHPILAQVGPEGPMPPPEVTSWASWTIPFPQIDALHVVAGLLGMAVVSLLAFIITRRSLVRALEHLVKRTKTEWDDAILQTGLFHRLVWLEPVLIFYFLAPIVFGDTTPTGVVAQACRIVMVGIAVRCLDAFMDGVLLTYRRLPWARNVPIKGFLQVIRLAYYLVAGLLVASLIVGKAPIYLLSGLGALTAVMMLIFKDPILGFVAGIQLTTNRMVAIGDWIEMPNYGADGDVIDVALTTVKVQNWDKTVTSIPTYALISESFKNWRGMAESGGRRIKRSVSLDMTSIGFCTEEMLTRFSHIQYIQEYLDRKRTEIAEHNKTHNVDNASLVNGRRLTNVGTFRAYVIAYLRNHPMINQDMTFLVRQLPPGPTGLPIEIYVFSADKVWANYEAIQADIFDHILAILPEFDLRVFQEPTGADWRTGRTATQ